MGASVAHKTNPAHAMVAGYLAGSSGTIVGYPLDSLKVWVQTNTLGKNKHLKNKTPTKHKSTKDRKKEGQLKSSRHPSSGARRSSSSLTTLQKSAKALSGPTSKVVRVLRALYSGVGGPLLTVGAVQSVNFCTYDATRRFLYQRKHPHAAAEDYRTKDSLAQVAMSGACAGLATATLTAPLLMIKIHQQITGAGFSAACYEVFTCHRSGLLQPGRAYGPSAFVPHAVSESIGRSIYLVSYEAFKRALLTSKPNPRDSPEVLSLGERMACAAGAGIFCWGCFFPLDALRNRMYHARTTRRPTTVLHTLRAMRREGAFYRGFSISLLRAGPVAACVLPVYDLTLEWLASWN